jgi:hypothetical protein
MGATETRTTDAETERRLEEGRPLAEAPWLSGGTSPWRAIIGATRSAAAGIRWTIFCA